MSTTVAAVEPALGTGGEISAVMMSGTSDRPRIRITVTSQNNAGFAASSQDEPDPSDGSWSVTFNEGDDFFSGDVNCDDKLHVNVEWLDPAKGWQQEGNFPDSYDLRCECAITITSLEGIPSTEGGMQEIKVSGSARACAAVNVTLYDGDGSAVRTIAANFTASVLWEARFVEGAEGIETELKAFVCGEQYLVEVTCADTRGCENAATLTLSCAVQCEPFVHVHVTAPDGGGWDDPVVGDLQCVTSGDYVLEVTDPPASDVTSYEWFRETDPHGTDHPHTVSIAADENVTYNVRVTTVDGCQPTFPIPFSCGGKPSDGNGDGNGGGGRRDDEEEEEQQESGNIACAVLLWIAIGSMLFGLVLLVLGCILAHFLPTEGTVLMVVGGVLFAIGWILFGSWLIVCAALTDCPVILAVRSLVMWLVLVFAAVTLVLALLAIGDAFLWPCAGIAAGASINWGVVLVILDWIAEWRECLIVNNRRRRGARAARARAAGTGRPRGSRSSRVGGLRQTGVRRSPVRRAPVKRQSAGLGTAIKRMTAAMGLDPCAGCKKRAAALDRWTHPRSAVSAEDS